MGFLAEFRLALPILSRASTEVPEMRLSGEEIVMENGSPHKFSFTAYGAQLAEFEAALADDPTVAEYTALEAFDTQAHYVVTYAESADIAGTYHVAVEQDISYLTTRIQDGGHFVRARVPDRDALSVLRSHCRENDLCFELKRIYREETADEDPHALTDAQHEALLLAYERGYFDSPRVTNLTEIADELDISRQALADRLRRGHKRLLEATIVRESVESE